MIQSLLNTLFDYNMIIILFPTKTSEIMLSENCKPFLRYFIKVLSGTNADGHESITVHPVICLEQVFFSA